MLDDRRDEIFPELVGAAAVSIQIRRRVTGSGRAGGLEAALVVWIGRRPRRNYSEGIKEIRLSVLCSKIEPCIQDGEVVHALGAIDSGPRRARIPKAHATEGYDGPRDGSLKDSRMQIEAEIGSRNALAGRARSNGLRKSGSARLRSFFRGCAATREQHAKCRRNQRGQQSVRFAANKRQSEAARNCSFSCCLHAFTAFSGPDRRHRIGLDSWRYNVVRLGHSDAGCEALTSFRFRPFRGANQLASIGCNRITGPNDLRWNSSCSYQM